MADELKHQQLVDPITWTALEMSRGDGDDPELLAAVVYSDAAYKHLALADPTDADPHGRHWLMLTDLASWLARTYHEVLSERDRGFPHMVPPSFPTETLTEPTECEVLDHVLRGDTDTA